MKKISHKRTYLLMYSAHDGMIAPVNKEYCAMTIPMCHMHLRDIDEYRHPNAEIYPVQKLRLMDKDGLIYAPPAWKERLHTKKVKYKPDSSAQRLLDHSPNKTARGVSYTNIRRANTARYRKLSEENHRLAVRGTTDVLTGLKMLKRIKPREIYQLNDLGRAKLQTKKTAVLLHKQEGE